ncbi:hypothetical protein BK129_19530 [Paenibacillus amylolyticus]|nr:hypothetical protein BK129_19530 [Paenibacillus amylolyticus]
MADSPFRFLMITYLFHVSFMCPHMFWNAPMIYTINISQKLLFFIKIRIKKKPSTSKLLLIDSYLNEIEVCYPELMRYCALPGNT